MFHNLWFGGRLGAVTGNPTGWLSTAEQLVPDELWQTIELLLAPK